VVHLEPVLDLRLNNPRRRRLDLDRNLLNLLLLLRRETGERCEEVAFPEHVDGFGVLREGGREGCGLVREDAGDGESGFVADGGRGEGDGVVRGVAVGGRKVSFGIEEREVG